MNPIDVPDGNWVEHLFISMRLENTAGGTGGKLSVLFSGLPEQHSGDGDQANVGPFDLTQTSEKYMFHAGGKCVVMLSHHDIQHSACELRAVFSLTQETIDKWQSDAWNALYNVAQTQYYAQQQDIAAKIADLEDRLNNVDTLTLRREESEEIMKGVLRFILGPKFDFMPDDVSQAIHDSGGTDDKHGVGFTGNELGLTSEQFSIVSQHENEVRFINQAIEWENVVSFLYSYFWDVPNSWEFIRQIKHPDALRKAFLRAGSARVVLTIRRGWEEYWTHFTQTLNPLDQDTSSPYLTIAQEIAAYDDRNYPGIPPANPAQNSVRLDESVYTTSKTILRSPQTDVEIKVDSSKGFIVGAHVFIDSGVAEHYPQDNSGRQEPTTITLIRDTTHITLAQIQYPHGLNEQPYAIVQPGEKGTLIAEWFEYTPTSGTDIAVTSNLATIA